MGVGDISRRPASLLPLPAQLRPSGKLSIATMHSRIGMQGVDSTAGVGSNVQLAVVRAAAQICGKTQVVIFGIPEAILTPSRLFRALELTNEEHCASRFSQ